MCWIHNILCFKLLPFRLIGTLTWKEVSLALWENIYIHCVFWCTQIWQSTTLPDFIQFAFLVKDVVELMSEHHYAGSNQTQSLQDVNAWKKKKIIYYYQYPWNEWKNCAGDEVNVCSYCTIKLFPKWKRRNMCLSEDYLRFLTNLFLSFTHPTVFPNLDIKVKQKKKDVSMQLQWMVTEDTNPTKGCISTIKAV